MPELTEAQQQHWIRLNRSGDAFGLARSMARAGHCSFCVDPAGPVRVRGLRDGRVPDSFGPAAMCGRCEAETAADPDVALLRVVDGGHVLRVRGR